MEGSWSLLGRLRGLLGATGESWEARVPLGKFRGPEGGSSFGGPWGAPRRMIPSGPQLGTGVGGPGRGRGGVNPSPEDLGEGGSSNYQPLNASAQRDLGWRILMVVASHSSLQKPNFFKKPSPCIVHFCFFWRHPQTSGVKTWIVCANSYGVSEKMVRHFSRHFGFSGFPVQYFFFI